jgi:hypothetical protein
MVTGVSGLLHPQFNKGATMPKIIFNRLLNGWFIVRGKHQTPIGGRFDTKQAAIDHLNKKRGV